MVGPSLTATLSAFLLAISAAMASPVARPARRADPVPSFVLANAPISFLYSNESWWPSDVAEHVKHMKPEVNFTAVAPSVTLQNISSLGSDVFLTSVDDVTKSPAWLTNAAGKPDASGMSTGPVTVVLVEKPGDILDAFFFYFYSFDHGGKVRKCSFCGVLVMN